MHAFDAQDLLVIFLVALILFGPKKPWKIDFRGGPRPPTHPLPADDSRLLNRHRSKPPAEL